MEPSWQPDPTGRHQYRWWDGKGWTDIVADNGEEYVDPHGAPLLQVWPPARIYARF